MFIIACIFSVFFLRDVRLLRVFNKETVFIYSTLNRIKPIGLHESTSD